MKLSSLTHIRHPRTLQVLAGAAFAAALAIAGLRRQRQRRRPPSPCPRPPRAPRPTATPIPGTTPTPGGTPGATPAPGTTPTPGGTPVPGPTLFPTPTGTPSPTAPLQFSGFYTGGVSGSILTRMQFRVNAQRQVTGQAVALNATGIGFTLPLRGTLSVASSDANNPNAVAFLDLNASSFGGTSNITYRFTGTVQRNSQNVVAGSGTSLTVFDGVARSETVQVTRTGP